MDKITVSDLFFNSKEAEVAEFKGFKNYQNNILKQAEVFLSNYPALKKVFTPSELAEDFLKRV